ncbi:MAG: heparinase II/III-family protein, partial [Chloroflexota bacterium]
RAGDNGQLGWGGHAHNDALSFEYSIGTRNFLVDPGAYTYTSDPESRDLFRSTAYHNTLRVDSQEISRIPEGELFRLENDVRCRDVACNVFTWEGEHIGYKRLGVIHRRRFEKMATGWRVGDTVSGVGSRTLEWFFHFDPSCAVEIEQNRVITKFASSPNIQITSNYQLPITLQQGFVSHTYSQRSSAPVAKFSLTTQLPFSVEFIISKL